MIDKQSAVPANAPSTDETCRPLSPAEIDAVAGGTQPHWSHDGTRIYYIGNQQLMSVSVVVGPNFSVDAPQLHFPQFHFPESTDIFYKGYDIAADGRVLTLKKADSASQPASQIHVILNWANEFKP